MEAFKYMVDLLKDNKASHIKIFGGGGGVIVPEEIKELEEYGIRFIDEEIKISQTNPAQTGQSHT